MESASTPTAAPEKASAIEDFIDIFTSPSKVFARRAKGEYGIQLLIVSLISAGFAFANRSLISQIFDGEFSRRMAEAMAKNPQLTQDMVNTQRNVAGKMAAFGGYIGTPIFIFIMAIIVWLVARFVAGKITYAQAAAIVTLAWIPRLIGSLVTTLQVVLTDTSNVTSPYAMSFSPARFMDPDSPNQKMLAIASNFDVFAIWFAVLMGIGIAIMANVPRQKGYIAAAVVFVLTMIPAFFR